MNLNPQWAAFFWMVFVWCISVVGIMLAAWFDMRNKLQRGLDRIEMHEKRIVALESFRAGVEARSISVN